MLLDTIGISLKEENTEANRKRWANFIIQHNTDLAHLLYLLDEEMPVPMRFIWMCGDLCERKPEIVFPCIPLFYAKRHSIPFPNYDRSLAKMFWLCGIPENMEGEAIDELFNWVSNAEISITTKTYAAEALFKASKKHTDIRQELVLVLEDQLLYGEDNSFKKRANKLLSALKEKK